MFQFRCDRSYGITRKDCISICMRVYVTVSREGRAAARSRGRINESCLPRVSFPRWNCKPGQEERLNRRYYYYCDSRRAHLSASRSEIELEDGNWSINDSSRDKFTISLNNNSRDNSRVSLPDEQYQSILILRKLLCNFFLQNFNSLNVLLSEF